MWHTSSHSNDGGHCVEIREASNGADVRDTVNRDVGHLTFPRREWTALLRSIH
ncbi:DUF397 domain-containing protein [Nocardiopsis sp. HNM0947]|uniref:DUF397 domain-containing protein n=1 Tax=Nocardiopsis coralli TaxID=2772213 RepID=A0ABR9P6Q9_9ACTN|nr:DUF397 domain-containing protein [Nocardiopsis coralli]MBE2999534.1 DUF397 domain-containing protein [Nocardiopsis coralli]